MSNFPVECAATSNNGFCGWRAVKLIREPENHMVILIKELNCWLADVLLVIMKL